MTAGKGGSIDTVNGTLRAADEDQDSVVKLARELVRIPSRGGVDPYDRVLGYMSGWLGGHGLAFRRLTGPGGTTVALTCEVSGTRPGPRYVLDACRRGDRAGRLGDRAHQGDMRSTAAAVLR
jgi:succinyl-diaminopimelate desuccinylase